MRRSIRYLWLALGQVTAIVVTVGVCIFTATGQTADQAAMVATAASDDPAVRLAQYLGANYVVMVAAAVMIAGTVMAIAGRRVLDAVSAAVIFLGASVTSQVVKHDVIARPDLADGWGAYGNSLPSGHATLAIAAACAAMYAVPARSKYLFAPALTAWAAVAGIGVVAAGWHRPSDVIVASLIVGLWCTAATMVRTLIRELTRSGDASGAAGSRPCRFTPVLVAGTIIAAAALCVSYVIGDGRASASAAISVVAIATTVFAALTMSAGMEPRRHGSHRLSAVS
ncbi:MAG: phosphatase PAP2 family protein [Microbacterium arborescens]